MLSVCGEMFQTTQCVNSPLGASGSSTINTRVFASAGMPEICKAGLVFGPSHVNFDGMLPPCWKAELVIFILAPPAANVAVAVRKIADTPAIITFRIDRPPIEIALSRRTYHIVSPKWLQTDVRFENKFWRSWPERIIGRSIGSTWPANLGWRPANELPCAKRCVN